MDGSAARRLRSPRETIRPDDGGELGTKELDCDFAMVAKVVREIDGRHAAAGQLTLDGVAVGEDGLEAFERFGRQWHDGGAEFRPLQALNLRRAAGPASPCNDPRSAAREAKSRRSISRKKSGSSLEAGSRARAAVEVRLHERTRRPTGERRVHTLTPP